MDVLTNFKGNIRCKMSKVVEMGSSGPYWWFFTPYMVVRGGMRAKYKVPEIASTLSFDNTRKNTAVLKWKSKIFRNHRALVGKAGWRQHTPYCCAALHKAACNFFFVTRFHCALDFTIFHIGELPTKGLDVLKQIVLVVNLVYWYGSLGGITQPMLFWRIFYMLEF